jgi:preprotein translocase subunit SecG
VTTGILVGIHVLLCISLVICVLMHSGKDAGLSSAFGLSQAGGSTQVMERNLTRLTVVIAVLMVCTTILLGFQTV